MIEKNYLKPRILGVTLSRPWAGGTLPPLPGRDDGMTSSQHCVGVITQSLPQSWVSGGHYLGIDGTAQNIIRGTGDGIKVFVSWGNINITE